MNKRSLLLITATAAVFLSIIGLMISSIVVDQRRYGAQDSSNDRLSRQAADDVAFVEAKTSLPNIATGQQTLADYGRELITDTSSLIGPDVTDPAMRFAGSNLDCQSCHLEAGTKPFASPYAGVVEQFPQYSARAGKLISIEDRINSCMTRSLNGKPLPSESREMRAVVAYMKLLSDTTDPQNAKQVQGFGELDVPERAVNLVNGRDTYEQFCVSCHQRNGQGAADTVDPSGGYYYPPLWGPGSYNDGAGMARVLTAAAFIKNNMPYGTTHDDPVLTDEEAYDVAGYINYQRRPKREGESKDYPKLYEKPADTPYGPYVGGFPPEQHRLGPFQPITARLSELKREAQAE